MLVSTCRIAAIALWSVSLTLFVLGLIAPHDNKLDYYAWGCLLSMLGVTACLKVIVHWLVEHILQSELDRFRTLLASAVGEAVGEELHERESFRLTPVP